METGTKALTGTTAATLTLTGPRHTILFSNAGAAVVYGLLNWKTGDTEVSATVFSFFIKSGDSFRLDLGDLPTTLIDTVRLISASNAAVGYIAG